MRNVSLASTRRNTPLSSLCPDEREDEPSLQEIVRDHLIRAGLTPLRDFTTQTTQATVLVTFADEVGSEAWAALVGFDVASDGPNALRVGFAGEFTAVESGDRRAA